MFYNIEVYAPIGFCLTCKNIRFDSGKRSSLLYDNFSHKEVRYITLKHLIYVPLGLNITSKILDLIVANASIWHYQLLIITYYTITKFTK